MASGASAGTFKISGALVESSQISPEAERRDQPELPSHHGEPMLLVIPRNPETLFVCWSVDWSRAFGSDVPTDRKAHLKLTSRKTERTYAVEPMSGHSSVPELEPGEIYKIELGYYAPANKWRLIASDEVTMPRQSAGIATVDVATIPFHLSFQRLTALFGGHVSLAQSLAVFGEKMAKDPLRSARDEAHLRELNLSADDLRSAQAMRVALRKIKTRPRTTEHFSCSSFSGS